MKIFRYEEVTSTQDLAHRYFPGNEIAAFVAKGQSHGYGKQGRNFYSPQDTGIYFSIAFPKFVLNKEKAGLLTLKIALEIVTTLKDYFSDKNFQLKWVNDIYLDGKKVAGILTELVAGGLIVGVGINVNTMVFPEEIKNKVASIDSDLTSYDKKQLINDLLLAVRRATETYQDSDFLIEYRKYSNVIGRDVVLQIGKNEVAGTVCAIDDSGRIVIERDGQKLAYSSGEISKLWL